MSDSSPVGGDARYRVSFYAMVRADSEDAALKRAQEMYPDVRDAMRKHDALPVPVGEATLMHPAPEQIDG